jgi:hypothetical protein
MSSVSAVLAANAPALGHSVVLTHLYSLRRMLEMISQNPAVCVPHFQRCDETDLLGLSFFLLMFGLTRTCVGASCVWTNRRGPTHLAV